MKTQLVSGLLLFVVLCGFGSSNYYFMEYTYNIENNSRLYIEGTSNINSFDCHCKDRFPQGSVKVLLSDSAKTLKFSNTLFKIKTEGLDCNNSKMNRDLCDALKSQQYPDITIELHDAVVQSGSFLNNNDEWVTIKVMATLTITNISKNIVFDVKGKKLGNAKYRFLSSKEILLTDYNVEPPTALLGLVKVRNNIRINFDLYTSTTGS